MITDLAERAARNMATFEAARADAHGDLHHQCFLPDESFTDTDVLLKHPVGTYFLLRAGQQSARVRLPAGVFNFALPGRLMAFPPSETTISTASNEP